VPELLRLAEGDEFAGKYRIGAPIGAGSMGRVYAAHHLLLDQKVAIKFLVPHAMGNPEASARFVREARAAARIKSAHVVRVLDVAVEGAVPYIVMEYLEGRDLGEWLRRIGPLPAQQATDFVLQACDAIHEAHRLDIIHRDIKPPNLFAVELAGAVPLIKVLDFGISKTLGLVPSTLPPEDWQRGSVVTEDRQMIGSPIYMSPEQMESARDVDVRTDIWALGVTLFEFVSGRLPFEFEGDSLLQVYSSIVTRGPLRLREVTPNAPAGLEAVIARCLQRDPGLRYRSVSELATALVEFGSVRAAGYAERMARGATSAELVSTPYSVNVPPSPRLPLAEAIDRTLPSPGSARFEPEVRRSRTPVSIALIGAALFTAVLAILGLSRGPDRPGAAQPASSPASSLRTASAPEPSWSTMAASADTPVPIETAGSGAQVAPALADPAPRRTPPSMTPSAPSSKRALPPSGSEPGATKSARPDGSSAHDSRPTSPAVAPTDSDWAPPEIPK
jgi:eukaryotic-like serine/threonine-protein kinase